MWLINGTPADTVHAGDRGVHFGDGLFETMALDSGRVRLLAYHLERLEKGCRCLEIELPDRDLLRDEIDRICHGHERAIVKLILTRGRGGRGYAVPSDMAPTRILSLHPWPEIPPRNYSDGVKVFWCKTRLATNPRLAGIKHLNRLEQVLARMEWDDPEIAEGLMLDINDNVIEGTCTNLFLAAGDELKTPAVSKSGVAGVMRRAVLETARLIGNTIVEREVSRVEADQATEMFLTNSIIGIWPVTNLDGRQLAIGAATRTIMDQLSDQGISRCVGF